MNEQDVNRGDATTATKEIEHIEEKMELENGHKSIGDAEAVAPASAEGNSKKRSPEEEPAKLVEDG